MKREILLVDDDRALLKSLALVLDEAGYAVRTAMDGDAATREVRTRRPDLVLLDVSMPGKSGFDVCRELRAADASLPIAFLTALSSPKDELEGLASGGDIYVPKTAGDDILLARVAALLRPRDDAADVAGGDFDFGGWRVEPSKLQMRAASGRPVALSEREIAALRIFAAHPGEVFGRDYLVMRLWGADADCTDNNLSVMLYALRRKFGRAGCGIACVRGVGYAYRP